MVIKKLSKSKIFDLIIVSASTKIAKIAKKNGAHVPFLRPKKISDDYTDTKTVIQHAIRYWRVHKKIYPKFVCCSYPTSIYLKYKDLFQGFQTIKTKKWDFVFQQVNL